MAAPIIQAIGGMSAQAGDCTPTVPAHQADDILLCVAETNSGSTPGTPTQDGGWSTNLGFQDNATENSRLTLFYIRATSGAMANPTMTGPANHIMGRVIVIRGCITTGDPWDVTSGGTQGSGTGIALTTLTTTVDECLVLHCVGTGRNASSIATFANWTNAALTGLVEQWDTVSNVGSGGGSGGASGVKATAGLVGSTTVDIVVDTGAGGGHITIAFKPPAVGGSLLYRPDPLHSMLGR